MSFVMMCKKRLASENVDQRHATDKETADEDKGSQKNEKKAGLSAYQEDNNSTHNTGTTESSKTSHTGSQRGKETEQDLVEAQGIGKKNDNNEAVGESNSQTSPTVIKCESPLPPGETPGAGQGETGSRQHDQAWQLTNDKTKTPSDDDVSQVIPKRELHGDLPMNHDEQAHHPVQQQQQRTVKGDDDDDNDDDSGQTRVQVKARAAATLAADDTNAAAVSVVDMPAAAAAAAECVPSVVHESELQEVGSGAVQVADDTRLLKVIQAADGNIILNTGFVEDRKRHLIGDEFYRETSSNESIVNTLATITIPNIISFGSKNQEIKSETLEFPLTLTSHDLQSQAKALITTTTSSSIYNSSPGDLLSTRNNSSSTTSGQQQNSTSGEQRGEAGGGNSDNNTSDNNNARPSETMVADFAAGGEHHTTGASVAANHGLTDMASILAQAVKNEPEDLTGHRRESPHGHNNADGSGNNKNIYHSNGSPPSSLGHHSVVVSTPDGPVVLSSAELGSFAVSASVASEAGATGGGGGILAPTSSSTGPGVNYNDFFDVHVSSASSAGGANSNNNNNSGSDGRGGVYSPAHGDQSFRPGDGDLYHHGHPPHQPHPHQDVHYVTNYQYKSANTASQQPHVNSPDSGIGDANVTPTTPVLAGGEVVSAPFDAYPHSDLLTDIGGHAPGSTSSSGVGHPGAGGINGRRGWQDYGRQNEEKIHIPKLFNQYGFRYILEAPSSSSVRREDDKITYVNKGQFYGITLEYTPDPESPPLKSNTVKSVIMLVFREGKTVEEEMKAWHFWHSRQHSVKQRILDADTKNSMGLVGCIEEVSHNALAVYWNPLESPAKVNIAVQCLSTDFSTQKGVKGLPLHVQIDTYDDPRDSPGGPVYHRGYCQIKVFCDKGAERKARDEERRAAKRRMTTSGKRRLDEMYHQPCERSEFYSMADLSKAPVLFTPSDDPERAALEFGADLPSFYSSRSTPPDPLLKLNGDHVPESVSPHQLLLPPPEKRLKMVPPSTERIMIYVRQDTEDAFTPLHLIPPSVPGLISALESKYKIHASNIRFLYRKNKQGIVAKIDDDMLRYYCNEDVFLMQVMVTEGNAGDESSIYDITLAEC